MRVSRKRSTTTSPRSSIRRPIRSFAGRSANYRSHRRWHRTWQRQCSADDAERTLVEGHRLGFLVPSEHGVFEIHPLLRAFLEEKFRELAGDRAPAIVELLVRTHLEREEWDDAFAIVERFFDADLLVRGRRDGAATGTARGTAADARALGRVRGRARGRCAGLRSRGRRARVPGRRPDEFGGTRTSSRQALRRAPCARLAVVCARRRQRPPGIRRRTSPRVLRPSPRDGSGRRSTFDNRSGASSLRTRLSNGMPHARSRNSRRTRRILSTTCSGSGTDNSCSARSAVASVMHSRTHVVSLRSPIAFAIRSSIRPFSTRTEARSCSRVSTPLRSTSPRMRARQASDYKLDFVLPHASVCKAAALWGLRRFKQCILSLDHAERLSADDGFVF